MREDAINLEVLDKVDEVSFDLDVKCGICGKNLENYCKIFNTPDGRTLLVVNSCPDCTKHRDTRVEYLRKANMELSYKRIELEEEVIRLKSMLEEGKKGGINVPGV